MSTIKANLHQIGSNATASKNIVLEADTSTGDLIVSKGVHDGVLTEIQRIRNDGSGMSYMPSGAGAVETTVQGKLRESVSVFGFMTATEIADVQSGSATLDVTAAIQAAIDYCQLPYESAPFTRSTRPKLTVPAGRYRITSTLNITNDISFLGEGMGHTGFVLETASATTPAIYVNVPDSQYFIGGDIGQFRIDCDGGSANGIGLKIRTGSTNSIVSVSAFHDIYIKNVSNGLDIDGVVYVSTFKNITISGSVTGYGVYVPNTMGGQVIYNSFADIEVTNVGDGAYAYYSSGSACHYKNLTCDGVAYFAGAYSTIDGLAVEGIAATTPVSTSAVVLNQIQSIANVSLINIPNSKCNVGINAIAANMDIRNVRFPDSGAGNQPNLPIIWQVGGTGTLSNVRMDRTCVTKLESGMASSTLAGFTITSCATITERGLSYDDNTFTPGFASWSTAPSLLEARYVKVGRIVTVFIAGTDGITPANATITGLPFTSTSTGVGGTASLASDDSADNFTARIWNSTTVISRIPARDLTGNFWQLTATYLAVT